MRFSKGFVRVVAIILAVILAAAILTGVFSSVGAYAASEKELEELKNKQTQLAQEKREVQARIDALEDEVTSALTRKAVIDEQINLTVAELDNITAQIDEYGVLITEKEDEIVKCQKNEEKRYDQYKTRIRSMEENGIITYCEILFGAKDWSDLLARVDYIQEIMTYDENVYNALVRARLATENAKASLETAKEELEETKASLSVKEEELLKQVGEADAYVSELEASLDGYSQLSSEQDAAEKELLRQIEDMAAELERMKSVSGTGTFVWPSEASRYVTSKFGGRVHPVYGTYRVHYGVDIGASYGTNVIAADAGTVVTAQYSSSYGNYAVVTHGNGYKTLYAHMSKLYVSEGDDVSQGSVIGLVGSTGVSTGPHLHYEVIKDGAKVNPLDFYANYELSPTA